MHHLLLIKIISIILILAVAVIAGFYPFKKHFKTGKRSEFSIGQALASGVFLGAGLMHMLGDAAQGFTQRHVEYPVAFLLAGLVYLALLFLEHISRKLYEHKGDSNPYFAILAAVMLSLHSLLAGAALGLGTSSSVVIILLLAILAHKWAASFALAIQINKSSLPFRTGLLIFTIFALMTPLGIILGEIITSSLGDHPFIQPTFNALAAGTFLYLGTLHGLKRSFMVEKCCDLPHFSFVLMGFAIMAIVAIWT